MTVVTTKLRCITAALCSKQDTDAQIESKESKVTIFYCCNISTNTNRYILIFTIPFSFEQVPRPTIRMTEIFLCLVCYDKSLVFLFGNRDKDKHKLCEKKRRRRDGNNFYKKWYLWFVSNSSCLWSFINDYTVH